MVTVAMKLKTKTNKQTKKKNHLFLGTKAMTNLDSILYTDIALPTKVHIVKTMVFPVK